MTRLLSFYGDDFTGSTDVMEALASNGVPTVLFTRQPTETEFAPFTDYQAFGLAGTSRSQTPTWMRENLPQAFQWLKALNAKFCHYKVCSTFDSHPHVGNIGVAADIAADIFQQQFVPMIVGVPQLKRFTFAGHLFAAYQGEVYRIDRHPVMSRHPVTPMAESDLTRHLALQTSQPVTLANGHWPNTGIGLIDVYDTLTQHNAGHALLKNSAKFLLGSSGIEYALLAALKERGEIAGHEEFAALPAVDRLIAVSGSVSPTTERQIRYSLNNGFSGIALDPIKLVGPDRQATLNAAIVESEAQLKQGKSVLVYTALGPSSDHGQSLQNIPAARQLIGEGLGHVLKSLLQHTTIKRAIIAGGDSSSHALGQLDIFALTTRFPLSATPGSPLCRAYSSLPKFDGLELAMKGGQVGGDDYFVKLQQGSVV